MVIHTRGQQNVYSTLRHVESHIFLQWVLIENQTKTFKKKILTNFVTLKNLTLRDLRSAKPGP